MGDKLPSMQWYPGDWWRDLGVLSLNCEERGAWFQILMLMHDSEQRGYLVINRQKPSDEMLSNILNLEVAKVQQTLSKLLANGVASEQQNTGIIYNRRMLKDQNLREIRTKAGAAGGQQTSSKRLANAKQRSTPSSSSSSSNTKTTTIGFTEFWKAFPKKQSKQKATMAWNKLNPNDQLLDVILKAVARDCKKTEWQKDGGKFIPHPATWLNGRRWEDETTVSTENNRRFSG